MKTTTIILTIVFASFATVAQATPSIPYGSTGGGGGTPIYPKPEPEPRNDLLPNTWGEAEYSANGFGVYAHYENESYDYKFNHTPGRDTRLSMDIWAQQGVSGYWVPLDNELKVRFGGDGTVRLDIRGRFAHYKNPQEWEDLPNIELDISTIDIYARGNLHTEHAEDWIYDPDTDSWRPTPTENINVWGYIKADHFRTTDLELDINDWVRDGADYDFVRYVRLEAELTPNPEPATMSLLALGGAFLLRRRRRS